METHDTSKWKKGSYQCTLADSLLKIINQWKLDREESWAVEGGVENISEEIAERIDSEKLLTKAEVFEIIENMADSVIATSKDLGQCQSRKKKVGDWINIFGLANDMHKYSEEHFEMFLARNMTEKLSSAAVRMMSLDGVMFSLDHLVLSPDVTNFLRLVIRTYIWGFDGECIILCCSAMEKAFANKVTYEMCEKQFGERLGKLQEFSLIGRIKIAKQEGLINERIAKEANEIRLRANAVLRNDPRLVEKVENTIHNTIEVISAITKGYDPRGKWWFERLLK